MLLYILSLFAVADAAQVRRARCAVEDFALAAHESDIDAVDWADVNCVQKSEAGNSGGVYFVQTTSQLVVVKPSFELGEAVSFALSEVVGVRAPRFRLLTTDERSAFEGAMRVLLSPAEIKRVFTQPVVMELVKTDALKSMADLMTPEVFCDQYVGGCFCPDDFERSLSSQDASGNCKLCIEMYATHLRSQEESIATYLAGPYVEEVCTLTALDTFLLEHDQLPDLRDGPFLWNGGNVMLSGGHAVNIDSALLHGMCPVRAGDSFRLGKRDLDPRQHLEQSLRELSKRSRGQLLTMLLHPGFGSDSSPATKAGQLGACGLAQEDIYRKAVLGPEPAGLWPRCERSLSSAWRALADVDLADVERRVRPFASGCVGALDFVRARQVALRRALHAES